MRDLFALLAVMLFVVAPAMAWEHWGGDRGGLRFSPIAQITPANVGNLVRAFEFRTGDLDRRAPAVMARTKFQATPLLVEDGLIFCSPFNEVIALDPGTGLQKWRYDPNIRTDQRPGNRYNCRGVAWWVDDQAAETAACRARIFMGTNDVRVIALDARTGIPCADFGTGGEVRIDTGKLEWPGEFQITSAPVVSRGVVVVGSAISDNRRVDAPQGTVRAFDARTGRPRWSFDPLDHAGIEAGHANVWAPMSADEERGMVLPTSSPSRFLGRCGPATTITPIPWWRCGPRPADGLVISNRASMSGLRPAGAADAGPHRHRRRHARRRNPADQAGFCVRARPRHRQAGMAGRGTPRAARRRGGRKTRRRSRFRPMPVLVPQKISPDEVFGLVPFRDRAVCREQLAARATMAFHAALDPGKPELSDDRRRRELGQCCVRSGQSDPLREHLACGEHRQIDSARRRGRLGASTWS
jgi:quinoprotein glucose dehydrogenase